MEPLTVIILKGTNILSNLHLDDNLNYIKLLSRNKKINKYSFPVNINCTLIGGSCHSFWSYRMKLDEILDVYSQIRGNKEPKIHHLVSMKANHTFPTLEFNIDECTCRAFARYKYKNNNPKKLIIKQLMRNETSVRSS